MFGISGIEAAGLGQLADLNGIVWVYKFCAYLPLLGLATILLPSSRDHGPGQRQRIARAQSGLPPIL